MGSLSSWIQSHFPPALTSALMSAKRAILPSPAYRQMLEVYDRAGRPQAILAGPFKGLRYLDPPAYLPKLLGCYENELHHAIEKLIALQPDVVLNIGSAEGYYAVGLAKRMPRSRVIAYDIAPLPRYRVRKLARLNELDGRVELRGYCSAEELQRVCGEASRPAVLIDCEGCEWDLLDPAKAPNLARAIILVELHEMCRPNVTAEIEKRFAASHDITKIATADRSAADLPPGVNLSPQDVKIATNEARMDRQDFMLLLPRSGAAAA